MRIKAIIIGAAATAGVAGIAFGGTAVSTAFSADSSASVAATGAKVAMTTLDKNMTLTDLVPGVAQTATFTVTNTSTIGSALSLTDVKFVTGNWGSNNQPPTASALKVSAALKIGSQSYPIFTNQPLTTLEAGPLSLGNLPKGTQSADVAISVTLDPNAGNNWNGASASLPFTLHLQGNAS
jgi:hypothetical protein